MKQLPRVESTCEHGGGDWSRVAAWVFDCLDREPPPPGGHLMLYLCHHPDDRTYFNSPTLHEELSGALFDAYRKESADCLKEKRAGGVGFGDPRFTLRAVAPPAHLGLSLQDPHGGRPETSAASDAGGEALGEETSIEFQWDETACQISPGVLGLVRRWVKRLDPRQMLMATLSVLGGASVTPHADRWQRGIRWQRPVVYLPKGRTEIVVGATAGCDLRAPALRPPLVVTYDSETDAWEWASPSAPWVGRGSCSGRFEYDYAGDAGEPALSLRGARLKTPRTLEAQDEENYMPSFTLEIVGCLLPLPQYGMIPDDLPAPLLPNVSSALQLPGGDWLYLNAQTGDPYLWRRGESSEGRWLKETGVAESLSTQPGAGAARVATWKEVGGLLGRFYCGEMRLKPQLTSRLAAGAISENIPHDVFTGYVDRAIGRAPIRLTSTDGLRYAVSFNAHARHPVFVLSTGSAGVRAYQPHPETVIDLGDTADFICGTTHYRLLRASRAGERHGRITPTVVSAGGVS